MHAVLLLTLAFCISLRLALPMQHSLENASYDPAEAHRVVARVGSNCKFWNMVFNKALPGTPSNAPVPSPVPADAAEHHLQREGNEGAQPSAVTHGVSHSDGVLTSPPCAELWPQLSHAVLVAHQPLVHQSQQRHGRDSLGHRVGHEERVLVHGAPAAGRAQVA